MMTEAPWTVKEFWNSDPRGNWINWLTIDADGWIKGHSKEPFFYKGCWETNGPEDITILIELGVAHDHPALLIWEKPRYDNDSHAQSFIDECTEKSREEYNV